MADTISPPRPATASVNDVALRYLDWAGPGTSAAPPVVMVHGLSAQGHTWDPIAAELARERRVITPDLRGHGDSSWAADGYALERFVSDIEELARTLGLEQIDYVGHSFGAQVGLALAGGRPDLVRRLVVNDMGPEMAAASVGATRATVADVKGFASIDAAEAHYRAQHPEWRSDFVRSYAEHQLKENWAGKWVPKADPDLFWLLGSAGRRSIPHVWAMTEQIAAPVLLLRCRRSAVLDDDIVGRMGSAITDLTVEEVDADHYFPREDPDRFVTLVRDFLSR